jgi:PAS domain S-box-containing protein
VPAEPSSLPATANEDRLSLIRRFFWLQKLTDIEKQWLPPYAWKADTLTFWRERILFFICFIAAVFGPIALIPSIFLAYAEGLWQVICIDLAAYALVIFVLVGRRLPLKLRASAACFFLYLLGIGLLFALGPLGAGYIWLFGASVLMSAILGLRAAIWSLVLNAAALASVLLYIAYGVPEWSQVYDNAAQAWLVMIVNFLLLNTLVTFTTAFMLNGLEKAIQKEQEVSRGLRQSRDERNLLLLAIEQAEEMIVVTNARGIMEYVNPAFNRVTGYTRDEIQDCSLDLFVKQEQDKEVVRDMWRAITQGFPWKGQLTGRTKSGGTFIQEASITPILDSSKQLSNFIAVNRDVTERWRLNQEKSKLEEEYRQIQKVEALGTLTGGIAHDFNNILGIILGYTELSENAVPRENPAREFLREVKTASLRGRDIVSQLLTFSREKGDKQAIIDITPVIKEGLKMLRSTLPSSVEFREAIAGDLSRVKADPTQMHQILVNLCTNAHHAMEDQGGVISISLDNTRLKHKGFDFLPTLSPGEYLKLRVADSGQGIQDRDRSRIFDPYFTTKDKDKGTGLGLSVVLGIVKSHGGGIKCDSTPGKGTVFEILLPAIHGQAESPEAVAEAPLPTGSETILFVDDESMIVNLNTKRLEDLGYHVTGLSDPVQALEQVREEPARFDLVITDMTMPGMTGDRLAREVLNLRPDLPVILSTGHSERISRESALEAGLAEYLEKPLDLPTLARAVRKVLDEFPANQRK